MEIDITRKDGPRGVVLPMWLKMERAHRFEGRVTGEVWHNLLLLRAVRIPVL